jgi:hypothetical protein
MQATRIHLFLAAFVLTGCATTDDPAIPLPSGHYAFQHRYAEQPTLPGFPVDVVLRGAHILITNPKAEDTFPVGVLAEGDLMWHAGSRQWMIGERESDRSAAEVGPCSAGPEVVDLARRIYWTC